jgi:predicted nucleic acid-binding protein
VKFLLDVNALIALGHAQHVHHLRLQAWLARSKRTAMTLHTCALTELGFVRVSVQAGLQPDIATARNALERMKATSPVAFTLLPDALGADRLPAYVRKPAELADGHLLELANSEGATLLTLDTGIPGAVQVPRG